jgi:hypothetical protein
MACLSNTPQISGVSLWHTPLIFSFSPFFSPTHPLFIFDFPPFSPSIFSLRSYTGTPFFFLVFLSFLFLSSYYMCLQINKFSVNKFSGFWIHKGTPKSWETRKGALLCRFFLIFLVKWVNVTVRIIISLRKRVRKMLLFEEKYGRMMAYDG